jgi:hypothetical protein
MVHASQRATINTRIPDHIADFELPFPQ